MTESTQAPGVALLFADAELGAHLHEALVALGARIVYEGAAAQVQPETLAGSGADVVVVNLEPDDEHFDQLCTLLDRGSQRVVFNDAEVSRHLSGWDKARWARHLAVKLLGSGDVDPPRPPDARRVETVRPGAVETADTAGGSDEPDADLTTAASEVTSVPEDPAVLEQEQAQSEALSAELEALLTEADSADVSSAPDSGMPEDAPATSSAPAVDVEQRQTVSTPAPVTDWELVDVDVAPSAPVQREDASQFGVEKMQAADYLKPEGGDDDDSPIEPGLKLELVSLEESVAPSMVDKTVSEMMLDDSTAGIRRVVLVGTGHDAVPDLGEFLAALPEALPALVLIVQHRQEQHADVLATALGTTTRLPVKAASDGAVTHQCEAWLVPVGQRCRVERNGRMSLTPCEEDAEGESSMDQCLDALAGVFGANTTAIVLAGGGRHVLAGAQSVIRSGGRVWTQDPGSRHGDAAAPTPIDAEGLATFSGSPVELARRLVEEYA